MRKKKKEYRGAMKVMGRDNKTLVMKYEGTIRVNAHHTMIKEDKGPDEGNGKIRGEKSTQ